MVHGSYNPRAKRCIRVFIAVQIVCFLLDLPFVVLAFTQTYLIKAALTSFAYAIKLKLEFIVLNQLLGLVKQDPTARDIPQLDDENLGTPPPRTVSDETLVVNSPRRNSLSPFWRKSSVASELPISAPKAAGVHLNEKIWADNVISPSPSQENTSDSNTLASSTIIKCNVDDAIFSHNDDDDKSFVDIERQYLGRFQIGQSVPSSDGK